jgi:hypothetical protein
MFLEVGRQRPGRSTPGRRGPLVVRTLIRIAAAIVARIGLVVGLARPLPADCDLICSVRIVCCRSACSGSAARRIRRCMLARRFSWPAARSRRCSSSSWPVPVICTLRIATVRG